MYTRYDAQVIETEGHAGDPTWAQRHEDEVVGRFKAVQPDPANLNEISSNWNSADGPEAFDCTKTNAMDQIQWERRWVRQFRAMSTSFPPV
jgi:hypothetical protein